MIGVAGRGESTLNFHAAMAATRPITTNPIASRLPLFPDPLAVMCVAGMIPLPPPRRRW